jgi:hypothetical protein
MSNLGLFQGYKTDLMFVNQPVNPLYYQFKKIAFVSTDTEKALNVTLKNNNNTKKCKNREALI